MLSLYVNDKKLNFEHSLVSLSSWESEFEKPFFDTSGKKDESSRTMYEMERYFELMLTNPKHEHLVSLLTDDQMFSLAEYMQRSRTATTVNEIQRSVGRRENVTSELIYYWLVAFRIPFQPTETWHLNRLLTLVRVCSAKNAPEKKKLNPRERAQQAQDARALNEKRRASMGTRG